MLHKISLFCLIPTLKKIFSLWNQSPLFFFSASASLPFWASVLNFAGFMNLRHDTNSWSLHGYGEIMVSHLSEPCRELREKWQYGQFRYSFVLLKLSLFHTMSLTTDLFTGRHTCAIPQLDSNRQHEIEHAKVQAIIAEISKIKLEFMVHGLTYQIITSRCSSNRSYWLDERNTEYCSSTRASHKARLGY